MKIDYIRRYSSHSRSELTHAILLLYSKSDFKLRDSLCSDIHDRDKNDTATLEMQQWVKKIKLMIEKIWEINKIRWNVSNVMCVYMYIYSKFHYRISCKIIRRMLMICHTSMLFWKNLIRKYDSRTRFNPDIYNILRMFVRRSWIRNFNRCSNWSGNISLFQRQADNIYRIQKCKYITILTKIRERDCYCFKNILIFYRRLLR